VFDDVDGERQAVRITLRASRRDAPPPDGEGWLEGDALTEVLKTDGALRRALAIVQAAP
jgi:hypothetical protein